MSARFLHDSVRFVQKRILWLFVRGFTFRTKIVRELCSVQYIDIQYITRRSSDLSDRTVARKSPLCFSRGVATAFMILLEASPSLAGCSLTISI